MFLLQRSLARSGVILAALAACQLSACNGPGTTTDGTGTASSTATDSSVGSGTGTTAATTAYDFPSRYDSTRSSVAHDGQTFRHVLMHDMDAYIDELTEQLESGRLTPKAGDISSALAFYYAFDAATSAGVKTALATDPALKYATYDAFPSQKNLKNKLAGNDKVGARKDWTQAFTGFAEARSPEALLLSWFSKLDEQSVAWFNGDMPQGPDGQALPGPYITPDGLHLQEAIEKLLLGAMAFSQAADDYLDDSLEGEGLNAPHTRDAANSYTTLEHMWDEAFGWYGAPHDMSDYAVDELAAAGGREGWKSGWHDTNGDGAIDPAREYVWKFLSYAAKRERTAKGKADFNDRIFNAFVSGRALLASAPEGALSAETRKELIGHRDTIVREWEGSIAATVISYVNKVIAHTDRAAAGKDWVFADHAKHWTEMKVLSLAFQFNPRSRLTDDDFAQLQKLLGERPVVSDGEKLKTARQALLDARGLIGTRFAFDAADLGDNAGAGGW